MKKMILFLFIGCSLGISAQKMHKDFVYLKDIDESIQTELRYFSNQNFIGKPIDGYQKDCVILTKQTAEALQKVQYSIKTHISK